MANELYYNGYYEYALKIYKNLINHYCSIQGKGVTAHLNRAAEFGQRVKQIYSILNKQEEFSSYINLIRTKFKENRYFRSQFLERIKLYDY